jgi:hypothetical protein
MPDLQGVRCRTLAIKFEQKSYDTFWGGNLHNILHISIQSYF